MREGGENGGKLCVEHEGGRSNKKTAGANQLAEMCVKRGCVCEGEIISRNKTEKTVNKSKKKPWPVLVDVT